jgi:GntR family transcriptional regulator
MSEVVAHIEEIGHRTQVELLEFNLQRPPDHVRTFFDSPRDQTLHRAVRLRYFNGRPFIHVETYVPAWIGNKIRKEQLERRPFYEILQKMGIEFSSGEQTVSATLANPVVAGRLGTDVSAALVRVRRFHRDAGGRPVQYIEFLASPSVFELRMKLDSDDLPRKPK